MERGEYGGRGDGGAIRLGSYKSQTTHRVRVERFRIDLAGDRASSENLGHHVRFSRHNTVLRHRCVRVAFDSLAGDVAFLQDGRWRTVKMVDDLGGGGDRYCNTTRPKNKHTREIIVRTDSPTPEELKRSGIPFFGCNTYRGMTHIKLVKDPLSLWDPMHTSRLRHGISSGDVTTV